MTLLPNAKFVDLGPGVRGGPYDDTRKPKVCWHMTQGSSLAGARSAFAAYPPHIGYDPKTRELEQYVPLDRHSYAFFNSEADDEYIIQIEVVGFSEQAHLMPDWQVQNIVDDLVNPLEELIGVPPVVIRHGFRGAGEGIVLATPDSPIRISLAELREFSGHLGHQHIPGDGHWDPGKFRIDEVLERSQGDDMTPDELLNTTVRVEGDAPNAGKDIPLRAIFGWSDSNFNGLQKANAALVSKLDALVALVGQLAKDPALTPERAGEIVQKAVSAENAVHLAAQQKQLDQTVAMFRDILAQRDEGLAAEVMDELSQRLSAA